jgi:hypothetical protein
MAQKLRDWFGLGLEEYLSSGQELDAFSITLKGIKIMVEVIWTSSTFNFNRDTILLLRTDAHIKILIVNPEILRNESMVRDFEKTRLSEALKGIKIPPMIDGDRVLHDSNYIDNEVRNNILQLVKEFDLISLSSRVAPISVTPSTYTENIRDITRDALELFLNEIRSSSNPDSQQTAWEDLERVARQQRIWKIDDIWSIITHELISESPKLHVDESLALISRMLMTASCDGQTEVAVKTKRLYEYKLKEIISSTDSTWERQKSASSQILRAIANVDELFRIFWSAWKRCVTEIRDDSTYTSYIGYFVNDLIGAEQVNKDSIIGELYGLIRSSEEYISRRAKALHKQMFS